MLSSGDFGTDSFRIRCRKFLTDSKSERFHAAAFSHLLSVDSDWLNLFEVDNSGSTFGDSN